MGSLLGVSQGSANPPKLVVLRWQGGERRHKPYALVGKGITFDTGGISLKPGAGMEEMKFDMCGAAGMLGTFRRRGRAETSAQSRLRRCGGREHAGWQRVSSERCARPACPDITIEVLNTDAEGRLILCDALTYVQKFDPQVIIDAATLTGACVVALGKHASGLMTKDEELAEQLLDAGNADAGSRLAPAALGRLSERARFGVSPTSPTSAASTAARSPPAASCRASRRAIAGRIWISPAPRGTKVARAGDRSPGAAADPIPDRSLRVNRDCRPSAPAQAEARSSRCSAHRWCSASSISVAPDRAIRTRRRLRV